MSKISKTHPYFFAVIGFIVLGVALFTCQSAIAKQLDSWQLLPRPQRFTELYFTDQTLPVSLKRGANQKVTFTLHNMEHAPTAYHYQVVAALDDNRPEQVLGTGDASLTHNQSKTITQPIVVPTLGGRVGIRVNLAYNGIAFGADKPSPEKQSIQFWAKLTGEAAHAAN